jgi:hypothetical protein
LQELQLEEDVSRLVRQQWRHSVELREHGELGSEGVMKEVMRREEMQYN